MLQNKTKQQINLLLDLQQYKSMSAFFKEHNITDLELQKAYIVIATCGVKKQGNNHIINYQFFDKLNINKKDIQEYVTQTRRPKVWKNWATFQFPEISWDEDIVSKWLADLPDECYRLLPSGQKNRCFATIIHRLYKDTDQVITLERAKQKDARKAVDASEFTEEEWNAFDLIHDKIGDMSIANDTRAQKELGNFDKPLDI